MVITIDAEKMMTIAKKKKLAEIKAKLTETDYKCLKYVDGELKEEEYASTKASRLALRDAYNRVESSTTIAEVEALVIPETE